jgi:hypothetical protein
MLVNAKLLYILVDGLHYSSGGQVILTVNLFNLATETEQDQTRLPLLQ